MKRASAWVRTLVAVLGLAIAATYAITAGSAPVQTQAAGLGLVARNSRVAAGGPKIRAAVIGPSGGLMTSSSYTASATLGEPLLGTTLASTSYRVCAGFECIGNHVSVPGVAMVPIVAIPCDALEKNDNRREVTGGQVSSGVVYSAKLCKDDAEDNYLVDKTAPGNITITLSMPAALVNHTLYYVYATSNFTSPIGECTGSGLLIPAGPYVATCPGLAAGGYVLRMYTDLPGIYDNNNPYTFSIAY